MFIFYLIELRFHENYNRNFVRDLIETFLCAQHGVLPHNFTSIQIFKQLSTRSFTRWICTCIGTYRTSNYQQMLNASFTHAYTRLKDTVRCWDTLVTLFKLDRWQVHEFTVHCIAHITKSNATASFHHTFDWFRTWSFSCSLFTSLESEIYCS